MSKTICVCGAGTMGSGIAQVSASAGFKTILFDVNGQVLKNAKNFIQKNLQYLVSKNKISNSQEEEIYSQVFFTENISHCKAEIIIEAIIEKESAKISLFQSLSDYNNKDVIFASNTSSLSISSIQEKVPFPERVVGMHFFNPAYIMKLVEVVKGIHTDENVIKSIVELCKRWEKLPVVCKDAPGFIVNRVARHYYLEALKLVEEGVATFEEIDGIMEARGFKMGPFRLMDLIGMDVNLAVSQSLYEAYNHAPRFEPSQIQIKKVNNNQLGKKTGSGFYEYK